MLVFRGGKWFTVNMPNYIDPAWGFGDRQKVASIMVRERLKGATDEDGFAVGEKELYHSSLGNNIAAQSTKKNRPV